MGLRWPVCAQHQTYAAPIPEPTTGPSYITAGDQRNVARGMAMFHLDEHLGERHCSARIQQQGRSSVRG